MRAADNRDSSDHRLKRRTNAYMKMGGCDRGAIHQNFFKNTSSTAVVHPGELASVQVKVSQ